MINHYETHATQPPIEKLEAIATAFGIKPSQLLDKKVKLPENDSSTNLTGIDPRSVKKLKDILSLPPEARNVLYRMLNELLRKNQLEERERGSKKMVSTAKQ
jgi:transcriptional regulator with XRE-family HTH domain